MFSLQPPEIIDFAHNPDGYFYDNFDRLMGFTGPGRWQLGTLEE